MEKSKILKSSVLLIVFLFGLFPGCSEKSSVQGVKRNKTAKVETRSGSSGNSDETSNATAPAYSHRDHFAAIRLDVGRIINQKEMQEIDWENIIQPLFEPLGDVVSSIDEVENITFMFDQQFFSIMGAMSEESGPSPVVSVIRSKASLDMEQLAETFVADAEEKSIFRDEERKQVVWFADDRTLVVGSPETIDKLIDGELRNPKLFDSPVFDQQTGISGNIFIAPIRPTIKTVLGPIAGFNSQIGDFLNAMDALQRVDFEFDLSNKKMGGGSFHMIDESSAKSFKGQIDESIRMVSGGLAQAGPIQDQISGSVLITPKSADIWPGVIKQILEGGTKIVQKEKDVVITVTRPEQFDELLEAMAYDAKVQVEVAARTERLQSISDAVQLYLADHNHFPAAHWKADEESQPFSWRVALLPHLGQQELYDQFKFDEPWDSEHNMEVAKMIPDAFSGAVEGKTTLHVVGKPGGAFEGENPVSPADITDEHEKTVLIVECDEESAVFWHEPSLLEFSKDESLPKLGRTGENGTMAILVNGQVATLGRASDSSLRAVLSANGKDRVGRKAFLVPLEAPDFKIE